VKTVDSEDEDTTILRNLENHSPSDAASRPSRPQYSITPPQEPPNSQK